MIWYMCRKHVITASKSHDVLTKRRKLQKDSAGAVNLWPLFEKISGLVHINPNIPALKYGRAMEVNAANDFHKSHAKEHQDFKLAKCGLFLHNEFPFLGASPDRIVKCSCCGKACLEVKCPMSINYTTPQDPDAKLPYLLRDYNHKLSLNNHHKYCTQCQVQMGVTGLRKCFFFVWTSHGYFAEEIHFDVELWEEITNLFTLFYKKYYLESFFG